ncbi:MAG TPA: hypothetical protein VFB89_05455, partial [Gemmatimonadales bacterium]|nr:hypothetical protein [Gemmatimonadales bacterium]
PDVVAAVLSDAWGIPVPVEVIWPELRDGQPPAPAHLQPWAAARTLDELGLFLRSDMLTRRAVLAASVSVATGKELIAPIARWLSVDTGVLPLPGGAGPGQINIEAVEAIEEATRHFMAADAAVGGAVVRRAAAGHLLYAVDLATEARYSEDIGNRLLIAIADLAGHVGWMSHDAAMEGPAQRYLIYGLQAAREAHGDEAQLRAVGILADMSAQMNELGHPSSALRLTDLAFEQLPADGRRFNKIRSLLWSQRAARLSGMGTVHLSEVRSAVGLAFDLYGQLNEEDESPAVARCFPYTTEAEIASSAAKTYRTLALHDPTFAADAERQALSALALRPPGFQRSLVFDQINLAQARFLGGEPEQACQDGAQAIEMAARVTASSRVNARLAGLMTDSEPFKKLSGVREFRERLRTAGDDKQ